MTTVVVADPFEVCLSGTVYGPGEVVEAPDEVAARIQTRTSRAATPVLPPGHRPVTPAYLAEVAAELNNRPRKRCDFDSPAQVLNRLLSQPPQVTVASEP
jgi:hypothetical protein